MKTERRAFLLGISLLAAGLAAAGAEPDSVRGKLVQKGQPVLETAQGAVKLEGEPETMAVLEDARLAGADMEFRGARIARDRFRIGPFFESKSMFVHRGGKVYTISYWCETCSIRTYTPGKCMCCQQETELKLEEYAPR